MIYFKSCPRCSGDMRENDDMYGKYIQCIQCGHEQAFKSEASSWSVWDSLLTEASSAVQAA